MSRLRRLKERKRKNRIKATSYGLVLALAVGSAQGLGTYALFTDTENVPSDIALSTGDVDVKINPGTDFTDVKPGDVRDMPLEITNNGTLNQNIKLDLLISDAIREHIIGEFMFDGITINKDNGVMYNNGELFVLAPGSSINGSIKITVKDMNKEEQNKLAGNKQSVNLTVKSTQISDNKNEVFNDGFYDEVTQTNTITVAEREIITIATGKNAHYTGKHGKFFNKLYIPVNVKANEIEGKIIELSAIAQESDKTINYGATYYKDKDKHYILIQDENGIKFKGNVNITINVVIKDKAGNQIDSYQLKCNVYLNNAGNSCKGEGEGHPNDGEKQCHMSQVNPNHTTVISLPDEYDKQPPQEELDKPSKPEIIEPPKEEIEKPNEPEIVEPPKEEIEKPSEPEVIEPPKEEITEIPKQLEAIEPPKEGITEIQE